MLRFFLTGVSSSDVLLGPVESEDPLEELVVVELLGELFSLAPLVFLQVVGFVLKFFKR